MVFVWLALLIIIAVPLIWLARQNPEFDVSRKRVIQAPAESIFSIVSDLKTWPEWTPWLAHEPDCKLEYSDNTHQEGSWYRWKGQLIGAGQLTQNSLKPHSQIISTIRFTKPMRAENTVYWQLRETAEGTEVLWGMRGRLAFHMRWMSNMMDKWMGKDYEIGLNNLALQAGDTQDALKLSFPGQVGEPELHYVSLPFSGSLEELPKAMREAFPKLMQALEERHLKNSAPPMAIYHKIQMKQRRVECEIAIPLSKAMTWDGFQNGTLPAQVYSRTQLAGEYHHLETAWAAAFNHLRMAKLKYKPDAPMIERYLCDPRTHRGLDILTELDIPVKTP